MNLRSLRYVIEVCRQGNHISKAAEALHASQPGVSKHIQTVESELGFEIFSRKRNRIVGLTEPGRELISRAQRIISDVDSLRRLGEEYAERDGGSLTIATTHTQARYVLPRVIEKFVRRYPLVRLGLRQGDPVQIYELVESGEVDMAIGPQTTRKFPNLVMLPCFKLSRSVVARTGHPILRVTELTLEEIAKYPIITHDPAYSGRWGVMDAFQKAGLQPNVIFAAMNVDVSKTYVALGLGIAILTTISFDRSYDQGLRARDASHLFAPSTTLVVLKRNSYLRAFVFDLIKSLAPQLAPDAVKAALRWPATMAGPPSEGPLAQVGG
ncbi:MAG: LysR family transcriptional regulator [Betaproteobacteria bacterium]|nr:LysR family transcriptional regulator [Betaproteobacteria bacterium]